MIDNPQTDRRERYAVAIHDAMEPDLSLVDQEPGCQALFARAAEAAVALADSEQAELRREQAERLEHLEGALARIRDRAEVAQVRVRRVVAGSPLAADVEAALAGQSPAVLPAVPVPPATHATVPDRDVEIERMREQLEEAEDTAEQLVRNVQTVAREREGYRRAWKEEQQRRVKAEHELRRVADEAQQQPDTETRTVMLADVYHRLADEAAEWLGVITEQELRRKARAAEQQPAAVEQPASGPGRVADEDPAETPEVVHGCPPDGSGLTPCCGRTPFELPRGDRISSEAPVTCRGAQ